MKRSNKHSTTQGSKFMLGTSRDSQPLKFATTAHAILLSKVAGEVVLQYKDQDVPGDWQGHYFNNTPLPVFHTPPTAPSQLRAMPRARIDLSDVKVKVNALCKFAGLTEEDTTVPEPATGSSAAATAFRGKSLNAKSWWDEFYDSQDSFWQDKGNAPFAEQEVTDPKLTAWLPRLLGSNINWVQPTGTPEALAAAGTAATLLEASNSGVSPTTFVYPTPKRWIGRPKVAGDLPGTLHFFKPSADVTPGTIVVMLVDKELLPLVVVGSLLWSRRFEIRTQAKSSTGITCDRSYRLKARLCAGAGAQVRRLRTGLKAGRSYHWCNI